MSTRSGGKHGASGEAGPPPETRTSRRDPCEDGEKAAQEAAAADEAAGSEEKAAEAERERLESLERPELIAQALDLLAKCKELELSNLGLQEVVEVERGNRAKLEAQLAKSKTALEAAGVEHKLALEDAVQKAEDAFQAAEYDRQQLNDLKARQDAELQGRDAAAEVAAQVARLEIERLRATVEELEDGARADFEEHERVVADLNTQFQVEMTALRNAHRTALLEIENCHLREKAERAEKDRARKDAYAAESKRRRTDGKGQPGSGSTYAERTGSGYSGRGGGTPKKSKSETMAGTLTAAAAATSRTCTCWACDGSHSLEKCTNSEAIKTFRAKGGVLSQWENDEKEQWRFSRATRVLKHMDAAKKASRDKKSKRKPAAKKAASCSGSDNDEPQRVRDRAAAAHGMGSAITEEDLGEGA